MTRETSGPARRRERLALALAALAAGLLESLLPRPAIFPFMKLGLANSIVLLALVRSGLVLAIEVNLLRILATALAMGLLFTPTMLLSLGGGAASLAAMYLALPLSRRYISLPAVSVCGAEASLMAQLVVARAIVVPGLPLAGLVLPLLLWGLISGAASGALAVVLLRAMESRE